MTIPVDDGASQSGGRRRRSPAFGAVVAAAGIVAAFTGSVIFERQGARAQETADAIAPGLRPPSEEENKAVDELAIAASKAIRAGQWAELETLGRQRLAIQERSWGPAHPEIINSLAWIASSFEQRGRFRTGEEFRRRALPIALASLGKFHPTTADSLEYLAADLSAQGRPQDAEPLLRDALAAWQDLLGDSHPARLAPLRDAAFAAAQDAMGSAASAALARAQARSAAGGGPLGLLVARRQTLAGAARALDAQLVAALGAGDGKEAERVKTLRDKATTDLAATDAQLGRDFPAYAQFVFPSSASLAAIQRALGPDEGLSSLARRFLYAGAGALLASHWAVDDSATAALTTETLAIRRARPALTRAQALQIAMRTVRTGQQPYNGGPLPGWSRKWANPAQWAPFTIITNQNR